MGDIGTFENHAGVGTVLVVMQQTRLICNVSSMGSIPMTSSLIVAVWHCW